jgi:hypothetical protein
MRSFCSNLAATFAIVCGVLFVYGFLMVDGIKVSTREFKDTGFDVLITLPSVTPRYAWVQVYGCAAEITEDGVVRCVEGGWERSSDQQTRSDQRQYPFPWGRFVPRGTLLVISTAYDVNHAVLARGRTVVMR